MMNRIITLYNEIAANPLAIRLRRYISPLFILMLVATTGLWYLTKLSHTYTTEIEVEIEIEESSIETRCLVEGVGTNLIGYTLFNKGGISIPIGDLKYKAVKHNDGKEYLVLNNTSLTNAISKHFSDIKIISIISLPELRVTDDIRERL